ncbi:hypothetical protein RDI58_023236 [Solanum bulbocastanum]|uniref:Uncharacterized protein n=1 Tax=Solanum bulbocastanum TaxID=147425 RepID=A0AAN8T9G1_SOLBU
MGLNESYSTPKSQILIMISMPTFNKAYVLIIDQESQRNLASFASNSSGVIEGTSMYTHRSNTYSNGANTSKNSFPSRANGSYSGGYGGGYSNGTSTSGESYKARKSLLVCEHCGVKVILRNNAIKLLDILHISNLRESLICMLIKLLLQRSVYMRSGSTTIHS